MQVSLQDNESFEGMLGRFTRGVAKSGILQDSKRRRYFTSKSDARRDKIRAARRRERRRAARQERRASR